MDTIMKQSGLEVPCSNYFLGGRHTREVATASVVVGIIQDSFIFVNGKTSSKDGIDSASIENVSNEEIVGGLMANASSIISREVRPKLLCLKVDEEVSIPWVIRRDEEEVFIGEILIDGGIFSV
jgi:hypothetical protein